MNNRKITGQELDGRISAFASCRILARTAALGLMIALGGAFLSGCGIRETEKKATAEALPTAGEITPKFRVVPGINEADIAVWTETNASGSRELVMTEEAYEKIYTCATPNSNDAIHEGQLAFRRLDDACRELAALPLAQIALETDTSKHVMGAGNIRRSFGRARADLIRAAQAGQKVLLRFNPEAAEKVRCGITSGHISISRSPASPTPEMTPGR